MHKIGIGLEKNERERLQLFLDKFLWHVKTDKLAVCGGLTTRFHLITHGLSFPKRPFNDLDFLIENPTDIQPSVTSDFMLYHYHPDLWQAKPYRKPQPYKCKFCQDRQDYPITDMTTIYNVLGYVE